MQYVMLILLLAGCSSTPPDELSLEALAKRDAEIKKTCDFMVGPHPELPAYEKCLDVVGSELK